MAKITLAATVQGKHKDGGGFEIDIEVEGEADEQLGRVLNDVTRELEMNEFGVESSGD